MRLDAAAIARAVGSGERSAVQVVDASLARIAQVNGALNAFVDVYEDARDIAASIDAKPAGERGALAGVPVAIKDLTPMAGRRTTSGSVSRADHVDSHDAVVVQRLKAADAVIVGRTATPEFAFSSFTRSPLHGHTRNPWDPSRTCGGSSGGSAVAVATGCVPLAEGSDMGGSIRIPAALCGCVGLKPSLGRIPMDLLPTTFDTISHIGPIAHNVADAARFLAVAHGPDDADILSLPGHLAIDADGLADADVKGRRVALSVDLGFYAVDPQVAENTFAAARALERAGCVVEEATLPFSAEQVKAWDRIWSVFLAADFGDARTAYGDRMDQELLAIMAGGERVSGIEFRRLDHIRTAQWRQMAELFTRYDALLCATMALPAPPVETPESVFGGFDDKGRFEGFEMTALFNNVAPCPAISVPSGLTEGLPTGAQLVGRRHGDVALLELAAALERELALDLTPPAPFGQT
ncbi:MAG: amidase [Pseudomonadota bacterium]